MKSYQTRTIGKKEENLMKKLRNSGRSYSEIARKFNVTRETILYHLQEDFKKKVKNNSKEYYNKNKNDEKRKAERRKYIRNYQHERYANDPKFKKMMIMANRHSNKKKRKLFISKGLCSTCGKERIDKNFKTCEKCRRS